MLNLEGLFDFDAASRYLLDKVNVDFKCPTTLLDEFNWEDAAALNYPYPSFFDGEEAKVVKLQFKPLKKATQVVEMKKRVSFPTENMVQVREFDANLSDHEKSKVWFDGSDMDEFRLQFRKAASSNDPQTLLVSSSSSSSPSNNDDAKSYNHTRRVLLTFESCKDMQMDASEFLRHVSRRSSNRGKIKARRRAEKLYLSNQAYTSMGGEYLAFAIDPRLSDYYLETFLDKIMERSELVCGDFLVDIPEDVE